MAMNGDMLCQFFGGGGKDVYLWISYEFASQVRKVQYS